MKSIPLRWRNRVIGALLSAVFIPVEFSTQVRAASETASALVLSQSLQLQPSQTVFVTGVGNETAYFSTFNGTAGSFLVNPTTGIVSGELRPRAGSTGLYEGAYAIATPLEIIDYGSYVVSIPTTDSAGLGIPDVLQYSRAGTFSATGSGYDTGAGGLPFSISLSFSRAANSALGTYLATTTNSLGQSSTVTGQLQLTDYQGSCTYVRGATNTLSLTLTNLATPTVSITGSTVYTVVNSNQVNYSAFTAKASTGDTYSVLAGTLTRTGNTYLGSLQLVDGLIETYWPDFTGYRIILTDNNNTSGDGIPDFSDPLAAVPSISVQPASQTIGQGQSVTFSITASGAQSYQWYFNGVAIAGATGASLVIANSQNANVGTYTVSATNMIGTVLSSPATLSITGLPPTITLQPSSLTISSGSTVVLNVAATGAPTFQWNRNGVAISGSTATASTLLMPGFTSTSAGTYTCTVKNAFGTVTSNGAVISVIISSNPGRLINLATRAQVGTGANVLIAGFVIGGSGTVGSQGILLRASGPALTALGLPGAIPDPSLTLYASSSGSVVAQNVGWAGSASIATAANQVGAFPWSPGSKDSALQPNLGSGAYSAQISGSSGDSGLALAEVYGIPAASGYSATSPRLINLASRGPVGTGPNIMIGGFVIGGDTARTVLIRASGPALASVAGLSGTLPDPQLQLYSAVNGTSTLIQTNSGWGGSTTISSIAFSVGAFAWTNPSSADSALLMTLAPGAYSAQVLGATGDTGLALIEVYEVPE